MAKMQFRSNIGRSRSAVVCRDGTTESGTGSVGVLEIPARRTDTSPSRRGAAWSFKNQPRLGFGVIEIKWCFPKHRLIHGGRPCHYVVKVCTGKACSSQAIDGLVATTQPALQPSSYETYVVNITMQFG
jgi:hypothetical protein